MNAKPLPEVLDSVLLKKEVSKEGDAIINSLFESVLYARPTMRTSATEIVQRFLDRYNDARAAQLEDKSVFALFEKCRQMIEACRQSAKNPGLLTKSEVETLLEHEDSWDEPDIDLRLAPQALFLIGTGVMWGIIDIDHIHIPSTIISRTTSNPKGFPSTWDKI
jgi:hypothetical protein